MKDKAKAEHLSEVTAWLQSFSVEQQQRLANYYGVRALFLRAFDEDFGRSRFENRGGVFTPPAEMYSVGFQIFLGCLKGGEEEPLLASNFGLAAVALPSLRGTDIKHAVGIKIDNLKNVIYHQDPQGDAMRPSLAAMLKCFFPKHDIIDFRIPQQRDKFSCALITHCNLVAFAKGKAPDPNIDKKLMGIRAAHAPHFLNELSREKQVSSFDKETAAAWKSVARAIAARDTEVLEPKFAWLSDPLQFLFRLAPHHVPRCA